MAVIAMVAFMTMVLVVVIVVVLALFIVRRGACHKNAPADFGTISSTGGDGVLDASNPGSIRPFAGLAPDMAQPLARTAIEDIQPRSHTRQKEIPKALQ